MVGHGIEAFKASLLKAIAGGGAPAAKPQVTDEATLQAGQTILKSGLAISVAQSTKVPRFKTPSLSVRGDCSSRTAATQLPNYPAPTLLHSRARTPITDAWSLHGQCWMQCSGYAPSDRDGVRTSRLLHRSIDHNFAFRQFHFL